MLFIVFFFEEKIKKERFLLIAKHNPSRIIIVSFLSQSIRQLISFPIIIQKSNIFKSCNKSYNIFNQVDNLTRRFNFSYDGIDCYLQPLSMIILNCFTWSAINIASGIAKGSVTRIGMVPINFRCNGGSFLDYHYTHR